VPPGKGREIASALKSLTFTKIPKIGANPALDRRTNMIARLEKQKLLLSDPNYIRTVRSWVKKNGQLMPVDKQQRVLPWRRANANGSYVFFVRLGSKPIEFEKGKNAIAVPSLDKMPLVIDILITAVRNGELDQQLAPTKKPATVPKYLETVNNLITMIETMTDASRECDVNETPQMLRRATTTREEIENYP
jgi:uncharacterized protein DUF6641